MLKNMTRKSLALGAGLALVASGLAAAPAQAVATGQLWSAFGQTNEMVGVAGHVFTLRLASPAGVTGADADGDVAADELAALATKVTVTMVENANATTIRPSITGNVGTLTTASGDGTITVQVQGQDVAADSVHASTGIIEIAPPTTLTNSIQVDVQVTYDDGSKSEVERVTFVPSADVSADLTIEPVAAAASQVVAGTFGLSGINTANWVTSNSDAQPGATTVASRVGLLLVNGTTPLTGGTVTYSELTDTYRISQASVTVGESTAISIGATFGAVEINRHFDATKTAPADAASAKFTLAANAASAALDVAIGTGTGIAHNKTNAEAIVAAETVVALTGTKALNFTISSYTDSARTIASGSGVPVTVTLTDTNNGLGTSTITAGGKSLDVSGTAISFTLTTNSSGQIAFTVTADKAAKGEMFTMTAVGSTTAVSLDSTTVKWEDASFTLLPAVDGNFSIAPSGSIAVDYTVVDQFGNLAGSEYQLAMTRAPIAGVAANRDRAAEYASWSYVAPVSTTGRASATIVDNGLAATEGSDTVTVSLQKAATAGGAFIAVPNSTHTFVLTYENDLAAMTATALVNNNGIANTALTAQEPLKLETIALKSYDSRTGGSKPLYVTDGTGGLGNIPTSASGVTPVTYGTGMLRVFGQVKSASNSGVSGVAVKLSATGASFANAATLAASTLILNDSITVFTDATGSYEAFVRSSVAGTQAISVNAQGVLASSNVRFQVSTGVATALTISGPTSVAPGARADIVVAVVDKFGKAVTGLAVNFSDNGPGVLNASAVNTDLFGNAQVTLTTLAAESGTTVVTAYATIGGVITVVTHTITVGTTASVSDVVVNVGSFNGKLVVYALNAAGNKISYKIAGRWVVQNPSSDSLQRFDRMVGATGATVLVDIYVDGVKKLSKSVVTK